MHVARKRPLAGRMLMRFPRSLMHETCAFVIASPGKSEAFPRGEAIQPGAAHTRSWMASSRRAPRHDGAPFAGLFRFSPNKRLGISESLTLCVNSCQSTRSESENGRILIPGFFAKQCNIDQRIGIVGIMLGCPKRRK